MIINHITITYFSLLYLGLNLLFACLYILGEKKRKKEEQIGQFKRGANHPILVIFLIPLLYFLNWAKGSLLTLTPFVVTFLFNSLLFICFSLVIIRILDRQFKARYSYLTYYMLWNLPYCIVIFYNYLILYRDEAAVVAPLLMIKIKSSYLWILLGIWLIPAGYLVLRKFKQHNTYMSFLMEGSEEPDIHVLGIFYEVQKDFEPERVYWNPTDRYCLRITPNTASPISIGFFQADIVVFLPEKEYTDEQLRMIFRHELLHIYRGDSQFKFEIAMLSSLLWFFPGIRKSLDRYSGIMELTCDAVVLNHADEKERRAYADLILTTAADSRGFSSCLSSSGESVRYRLQNILHPGPKKRGYMTLIIVVFILLTTYSQISIAYGGTPRHFYNHSKQEICLYYMDLCKDNGEEIERGDEGSLSKEVLDYLEGLDLYMLTGSYMGNLMAYNYRIDFKNMIHKNKDANEDTPPGNHLYLQGLWLAEGRNAPPLIFRLTCSGHDITVTDGIQTRNYYTDSEIDWDYLEELIQNAE